MSSNSDPKPEEVVAALATVGAKPQICGELATMSYENLKRYLIGIIRATIASIHPDILGDVSSTKLDVGRINDQASLLSTWLKEAEGSEAITMGAKLYAANNGAGSGSAITALTKAAEEIQALRGQLDTAQVTITGLKEGPEAEREELIRNHDLQIAEVVTRMALRGTPFPARIFVGEVFGFREEIPSSDHIQPGTERPLLNDLQWAKRWEDVRAYTCSLLLVNKEGMGLPVIFTRFRPSPKRGGNPLEEIIAFVKETCALWATNGWDNLNLQEHFYAQEANRGDRALPDLPDTDGSPIYQLDVTVTYPTQMTSAQAYPVLGYMGNETYIDKSTFALDAALTPSDICCLEQQSYDPLVDKPPYSVLWATDFILPLEPYAQAPVTPYTSGDPIYLRLANEDNIQRPVAVFGNIAANQIWFMPISGCLELSL
jgi:hypothetical protein